MAAGDRNQEQEQSPDLRQQELVRERRRFYDRLTNVESGQFVGSGVDFYEFVQPEGAVNQKAQSIDVLSGERSPDFVSRQVIAQRNLTTLDPINRYYAMGGDRVLRAKVTFTPLESNDAYGNQRLTPEAPTSVNVNFNVGGYKREGSRTEIKGVVRSQKTDILNAFSNTAVEKNPNLPFAEGKYRGFVFPRGSGRQEEPFNFYTEISNLASAGGGEVFTTFSQVEAYFPLSQGGRGQGRQNGPLTKTIGGDPEVVDTPGGQRSLFAISPRMERILRVLDYDTFEEFTTDHPMFRTEPVGGFGAGYSDKQVPQNRGGSPYDGYTNEIRAVLERIRDSYDLSKALEAANATLTRTERIIIQNQRDPVVYEFYDFETKTSFVDDPYISVLNQNAGTRPQRRLSVSRFRPAKVEAVFNYALEGYDNNIANRTIPESALPNLYVYQLAVGADPIQGLTGEGWDASPQGREVKRGYDGLVTLNEFISGTLPRLRADQNGEDGAISEYLTQYGQATQNSNVVVDLTSSVARRYYNQITDATSMNLYEEFNQYKHQFPLYNEVSIPMTERGSLNTLLNQSIGATSMVNSILNATPETTPFNFTSYGAIAPGVRSFGGEGDEQRREIAIVEANLTTKVYNFDTWLDATSAALNLDDTAELSLNGPWRERNGGQAAVSAWKNQVRSLVTREARQKMIMYKDLLEGTRTLSDSTTIMYKLVKYAAGDRIYDTQKRTVVQNFFFANTNEIDLLNFVDTQVKSNKFYQYELYAYDVVYGSKFEFRTRFATYPVEGDTIIERRSQTRGTLAFFSFNVNTKPSVKIVEYPLTIGGWRRRITVGPQKGQLGTVAVPTIQERPDLVIGGVSYPITKIIASPPLAPEASILSYQNTSNKILINLQRSVGEYLGRDALPYVAFNETEEEFLADLSANQKLADPNQRGRTVAYKAAKGAPQMLIYRADQINTDVATPLDFYKSFSGKLYKTLNITQGANLQNSALAYDFVDNIDPNRKYYYTFRSAVGDLFSNPTPIFEVELKLTNGFYSPIVKEFVASASTTQMPAKTMNRFIEIKGADIQTLPFAEVSQNSGFVDARTGLFASEKSLVEQTGINGITGNKFIVRLTSRDTGRKVNIVLDFTSKENR